MNTTTLRGVFPEPKPLPKKNFIKENMRELKRMQGLLPDPSLIQKRALRKESMEKCKLQHSTPALPLKNNQQLKQAMPVIVSKLGREVEPPKNMKLKAPKNKFNANLRPAGDSNNINNKAIPKLPPPQVEKIISVGVQTETPSKAEKSGEKGVIMYPSPGVLKMLNTRHPFDRRKSPTSKEPSTNTSEDLITQVQNLSMNENTDRKQPAKQDAGADPYKAPASYQKGVLPKYLRQRKEEQAMRDSAVGDVNCPPGHVLLPEEERKETLRVLRESYAERIQELNSMPVRSDTLKMKKRKMAIEEELKKIDEGIKVFQRPKVFVKVNA